MNAPSFSHSYMATNRAYPSEQWSSYIYPAEPVHGTRKQPGAGVRLSNRVPAWKIDLGGARYQVPAPRCTGISG